MRKLMLYILLMFITTNVIASDIIPKDSLHSISYKGELYSFRKDKQMGLADSTGKVILEPFYDTIRYFKNGFYAIVKDSIAGLINCKGETILPVNYTYINIDNTKTIQLEDYKGIKSIYDIKTKQFSFPYSQFVKQIVYVSKEPPYTKYILSNTNGVAVSDTFMSIMPFISGRALVKKDSSVGFIDYKCHFTEEPLFKNSQIGSCDINGFYFIKKDNLLGLLDSSYNLIIPIKYEKIICTYMGYLIAKKNGKYGIISFKDKVLMPFEYDELSSVSLSKIVIAKKGKYYGLISTEKKKVVTPFIYDEIKDIYYERGTGGTDCTFVNSGFNELCWDGYEIISTIGFSAEKDGKHYIISPNGEKSTEGEFDREYHVKYLIKLGDKYGVIENGKIIIPTKFDRISKIIIHNDNNEAVDDYYIVNKNGNQGLYSKKGKLLLPVKYKFDYDFLYENKFYYDEIPYLIIKNKNKKVGVYSLYDKEIIVPVKYEDIDDHTDEKFPHFIVENENGKVGAYSVKGKKLVPVKYEDIRYDAKKNQFVREE